ncbi:mob1/phocein family domain-containing protein [Phthorimaea operculella]|nr:mob1/phocein family domain-containing protein [Phthorimaea operculella]
MVSRVSLCFIPRHDAWYDERGKKCRLSAPQYVDYVMTYTQKTVNDETIFPTKYGESVSLCFISRHDAWYDERGKKCRLSAPQYVDYVMTYTQKTVNDETIFPTKYANEFPAGFGAVVRRVVRLLFHVVAHLYAAHFRSLALLRLHAHLHLTFAHLSALDQRYALIDHKETEVLRDLEVALRLSEPAGSAGVVTQPLATA